MRTLNITEGFRYNNFDTIDEDFYLLERDAPSPAEYEVIEEVPGRNGVLDFSEAIYGERKFKNRILTFKIIAPYEKYHNRKTLERELKRRLVTGKIGQILDTHEKGFHWSGKCKSVKVDDDHKFNKLTATIEFDIYPYLFRNKYYFDDVWDTFNFDIDVANWTKYEISGAKEITIANPGDSTVSPEIVIDSTGGTVSTGPITETIKIPPVYYTVVHGDYLYKIAMKYGITVNDLKRWNKLTSNMIYSGDKLIVKPGSTKTVTSTGETVFNGMTVSYDGLELKLDNGPHYNTGLNLYPGENRIKVTGNGTISIHYRMEVMA